MKKNDAQNQAELYRQERKERLAKQAKKKAKRTPEAIKRLKWVRKLVGAVIGGILALLAVYGILNFLAVPQKILTAAEVDGKRVTVAEYNYYYASMFSNIYQTAKQYDTSYYVGAGKAATGFDYTLSPDNQTIAVGEGDEKVDQLYSDYLHDMVMKSMEQSSYYYEKAVAAGISLSEEQQTEINEAIEAIRTNAAENNYSLNRYLNRAYGKGVSEKLFKRIAQEQAIVQTYLEKLENDYKEGLSDSDIEAIYNESTKDYDNVYFRYFRFEIEEETTEPAEETSADTETTADNNAETTVENNDTQTTVENSSEETTEEEKKEPSAQELLAREMLDKITDEESFNKLCVEYAPEDDKEAFEKDPNASLNRHMPYSEIVSNIDEDAADWVFDSERQVGDKNIFVDDEYVHVIYMVTTAFRVDEVSRSVRHILIAFTKADEEGNEIEVTDETKAKDYEYAEKILNMYLEGEKTEDAFAALANNYSEDYASTVGSQQEYKDNPLGGLYEDFFFNKYVPPFEDWAFDPSRQVGDTGIVETDYGYHIMYFVGKGERFEWQINIENKLVEEHSTEIMEADEAEYADTAHPKMFAKWALHMAKKFIIRAYYSSY